MKTTTRARTGKPKVKGNGPVSPHELRVFQVMGLLRSPGDSIREDLATVRDRQALLILSAEELLDVLSLVDSACTALGRASDIVQGYHKLDQLDVVKRIEARDRTRTRRK